MVLLVITAAAWTAPQIAPPPRPVEERPTPRPDRQTCCPGVVTAVGEQSITIRGFDQRDTFTGRRNLFMMSVGGRPAVLCTKVETTRQRLALTLPNGEVVVFGRHEMPERRFPVNGHLAAGGHHPWVSSGESYRLADVRVGDEVVLWLEGEGPEGVVRAVQIDRRPGGRVPVAPADEPDDHRAWHLQANAYQDWEERGIPLPDQYRPTTPAEAAKMIQQARERRTARDRLAPPPRLAKPKP